MNVEAIRGAVDLGRQLNHVFVATADKAGTPHLAAAGSIRLVSENQIAIDAWFCPGTVENVQKNPMISVVSWDPEKDIGHQMIGKVERVEETAMMDGFAPDVKTDGHLPQSERRLIIRVDEVLAFSHAPHSDKVE